MGEICDLLFISLCSEFHFTFSCLMPSSFASVMRKSPVERKIIAHFVHAWRAASADGWRTAKAQNRKEEKRHEKSTSNYKPSTFTLLFHVNHTSLPQPNIRLLKAFCSEIHQSPCSVKSFLLISLSSRTYGRCFSLPLLWKPVENRFTFFATFVN